MTSSALQPARGKDGHRARPTQVIYAGDTTKGGQAKSSRAPSGEDITPLKRIDRALITAWLEHKLMRFFPFAGAADYRCRHAAVGPNCCRHDVSV